MGNQSAQALRWEYGTLSADDVLLVDVTDADGVACREPYRVSISAVPDEVPQVAVRLAGIGTAVTPEATIPVVGKVTDDYGLDDVWIEYQVENGPEGERQLAEQPNGRQTLKELGDFDLRGSDEAGTPRTLTLQPGGKLTLSIRARDRYDLTDEPHAGSSQPFHARRGDRGAITGADRAARAGVAAAVRGDLRQSDGHSQFARPRRVWRTHGKQFGRHGGQGRK